MLLTFTPPVHTLALHQIASDPQRLGTEECLVVSLLYHTHPFSPWWVKVSLWEVTVMKKRKLPYFADAHL